MAQLPSEFPTLAIHLADKNRDPIITSSSSPSQLASLTSIAAGALVSHSAIQRIGLGRPERIMVEYPDAGAVIIETFLDTPESVAPAVAAGSAIQQAPPPLKEAHSDAPPLMAGFVIAASPRDLSRASEALVRVEMLGRRLQEEWVEEVKRDPGFAREVDSEVMNLG
ncbi:hypothetical protein E4U48_007027 [Claviceps purpurea]|nr:hypothetical protein E4U48_007027 [Claviceps purpurea]